MRILFVAPFGWQPKGTVRVRASPIAQALVERGHSVTIVIPPWDDPAASGKKWMLNGVQIVNLEIPEAPLAVQVSALVPRVVRAIAGARPDIVHVFKPKGISGAVAQVLGIARRLSVGTYGRGEPGPRIVVDTDDWEGPGGWNDAAGYPILARLTFAWQEPNVLRAADAVTVASRTLCDLLARHVGVPDDRIFYVPNSAEDRTIAVSDERLRAVRRRLGVDESPVVLLTTRFFELDPAVVAAAWGMIHAELPAARLLVVGDALRGEDAGLRRQLELASAEDGVLFTGWVQPEDLGAIYRLASCAVVPSRDTLINRARCSVKVAELVAAGVPVVAERVGQASEYVRHGQTGFTVPPGDAAGLAAATLLILRSPELRRRLAQAGATLIRGALAWSRIVDQVETAYSITR